MRLNGARTEQPITRPIARSWKTPNRSVWFVTAKAACCVAGRSSIVAPIVRSANRNGFQPVNRSNDSVSAWRGLTPDLLYRFTLLAAVGGARSGTAARTVLERRQRHCRDERTWLSADKDSQLPADRRASGRIVGVPTAGIRPERGETSATGVSHQEVPRWSHPVSSTCGVRCRAPPGCVRSRCRRHRAGRQPRGGVTDAPQQVGVDEVLRDPCDFTQLGRASWPTRSLPRCTMMCGSPSNHGISHPRIQPLPASSGADRPRRHRRFSRTRFLSLPHLPA